ncbi:MAG: hypothetical protein ACYCXA_02275 [Actinomycetes bacterium]
MEPIGEDPHDVDPETSPSMSSVDSFSVGAEGGVALERPSVLVRAGQAHRWLLIIAGVLYSVVAATTTAMTWSAYLAVLVPGVLVLVGVVRRPVTDSDRRAARLERNRWLPWVAVSVGLLLWEASAWFSQPGPWIGSYDHPTLSVLLSPAMATPLVRGVVVFVWLWGGWALVEP